MDVANSSQVKSQLQTWSTGSVLRHWTRPLLLLGMLAGFAVRLYTLGEWSLWYDETVSVYLARQSIPTMLAHTAGDIHPPGYYLVLNLWQQVTQPGLAHGLEFLFAWPSFWCGVLVLPLLYVVGRRLFGRRTALVAVWLATVNPFQIWYAQEVRMYTLGALLGLLCLWATLQFVQRRQLSWLAGYVVAAAAGLYTLYFFAFLLAAVNLIAFFWMWRSSKLDRLSQRGAATKWLLGQVAVLLLWLPWLPIFIRQATDPPVPPWRTPWHSFAAVWASVIETLAALVAGQTPSDSTRLIWAALGLVSVAAAGAVYAIYRRKARLQAAAAIPGLITIFLYVFVPTGLLYLITAVATPIYHVRYVFVYVTPFVIVVAWLVVTVARYRTWVGAVLFATLMTMSVAGLIPYWSSQAYRTDEMRGGIAKLAQTWRPGDAILANAGWIYPLLDTYWPTERIGAEASLPPVLSGIERLNPKATSAAPVSTAQIGPPVIVTGSVDGAKALGWGNPAADFYPISASDTTAALDVLAARFNRIWHFRLYDTVNDPTGVIRSWLAGHAAQASEDLIAGRDPVTLQLFALPTVAVPPEFVHDIQPEFADAVKLAGYGAPDAVTAGDYLYTQLFWEPQPSLSQLGTDISTSLRLYDAAGTMAAQADTAPVVPSHTWPSGQPQPQPLALPIPVGTAPGNYTLELIVYRQDNGVPLPLPDGPQTVAGQRWQLGAVHVMPPAAPPELGSPIAAFDYVDLLSAALDAQQSTPGGALIVALTWRPRPSDYRDTYKATFAVKDKSGAAVQSWTQTVGGDAYPSGQWPPAFPVRDFHTLPLDGSLPTGNYTLTMQLQRASDDLVIPARTGWGQHSDRFTIGSVRIQE